MTRSDSNARPTKSQRRSSRQVAARRRAQRRQLITWFAGAAGLAIILVLVLVLINRDDEESFDSAEVTAMLQGVPSEGRFLGDPDAPVDLVVYSDFQCPFCEQFDSEDLPQVIDTFVESGEVRVEWRPLPIISGLADIPLESPENESVQSSEAAMCAAGQDQFWVYSQALFAEQGAENSGVYSDEMLKATAADLGLDEEAFNACLDSGDTQDEVLAMRDDALARGVNGTPTFLINDRVTGYTRDGFDTLEDQIRDELATTEAGG